LKKCCLRLAVLLGLTAALALSAHLWAGKHYREAREALVRGDFAQAQQHLALCAKVWVWGAETRLLQARAARLAGEYDQAETYLRESAELGASPEAVTVERLLRMAQQGDVAAVESRLVGRVLQGHPDSVSILEVLTPAYLANYQLVQARECVGRWLEREPDCVRAWAFRAEVFERIKDKEQVRASYRRLVELDPDNLDYRLTLAGLLTDYEPRAALEHFAHVRARRGDSPILLTGLARCLLNLGRPDEARPLLDAVLAEHPDDWAALFERARLAQETGSAEEVEPYIRRAAALKPNELGILHGLFTCLERLGKRREAEEVQARLERVKADLAQVADLTRKVASRPGDPDLRCEVGKILMRNGLEAEGLGWLATALRADSLHPLTHQALAEYYERTGETVRAAEHREMAQRGPPRFRLPDPGGSR
jgi:Tfp pilus assembly protein PilF